MFCSLNTSSVRNVNMEVGTKNRAISAYWRFKAVYDQFSDDLHIYQITEIKSLLNLRILKIDISILDF